MPLSGECAAAVDMPYRPLLACTLEHDAVSETLSPQWVEAGEVTRFVPSEITVQLVQLSPSLVFCFDTYVATDGERVDSPRFLCVCPELQSLGARHLVWAAAEGTAISAMLSLIRQPHLMYLLTAVAGGGYVCPGEQLEKVRERVSSMGHLCSDIAAIQPCLNAAWEAGVALRQLHTASSLPWAWQSVIETACAYSPPLRESVSLVAYHSLRDLLRSAPSCPASYSSVYQVLAAVQELIPLLGDSADMVNTMQSITNWLSEYVSPESHSPTVTLNRCHELRMATDIASSLVRGAVVQPELSCISDTITLVSGAHNAVAQADVLWYYRAAMKHRSERERQPETERVLATLCDKLTSICTASYVLLSSDYSLGECETQVVPALCDCVCRHPALLDMCVHLIPTITYSITLYCVEVPRLKYRHMLTLLLRAPVRNGGLSVTVIPHESDAMGEALAAEWSHHLSKALCVRSREVTRLASHAASVFGIPVSRKKSRRSSRTWAIESPRHPADYFAHRMLPLFGSLRTMEGRQRTGSHHGLTAKPSVNCSRTSRWCGDSAVTLRIGHNTALLLCHTGGAVEEDETLMYVLELCANSLTWRRLPCHLSLGADSVFNAIVYGGQVFVVYGKRSREKRDNMGVIYSASLRVWDIATETWSTETSRVAVGLTLQPSALMLDEGRVMAECYMTPEEDHTNVWCYNLDTGIETILPSIYQSRGHVFLDNHPKDSVHAGCLHQMMSALRATGGHEDTYITYLPALGSILTWQEQGIHDDTGGCRNIVNCDIVQQWDPVTEELRLLVRSRFAYLRHVTFGIWSPRLRSAVVLSYAEEPRTSVPRLVLLIWERHYPRVVTVYPGGTLLYGAGL
ncbi:hypothetical protein KIPB_001832 [Kipferlia bialata]|uniref:Uncharacterized protein n=1 Tax=Kipferlia bialata TaxID=797122 RepID=A0A9K3CPI1_9EUKA|nr:hypothetical protein KIPB_001832 [Kipferlia bialata]|eukprot:g1832.t1